MYKLTFELITSNDDVVYFDVVVEDNNEMERVCAKMEAKGYKLTNCDYIVEWK